MRGVFGLEDDGCQSTPPSAAGAEPRNDGSPLTYAYGVKMQPTMYRLPSGALPGHILRVEHWFVNGSPFGNGCVFQRFAYFAARPLSCCTFFSGIPNTGLPVRRFRMYTQPVFDATPTAGVTAGPFPFGRSNRIGGFVTS